MRAGFPSGTHRCRLSDEAHSLLGQGVCAYDERNAFTKTLFDLLKHLLELSLL
jgi:hypothetical protein